MKTFDKNIINSTNNKLLSMKQTPLIQKKPVKIPRIDNLRAVSNNVNTRNSFNLIDRYKEKDYIDRKFSYTFLPLNMMKFNDRIELKWYIKEINKRLNIIYVLSVLEQVETQINSEKKKANNFILKSTISQIGMNDKNNTPCFFENNSKIFHNNNYIKDFN